ncbi:peptidoglycan-binding protein LysM [Gelidibacter gilvus]|uniref:Potassium binding protein Kbp n=1 Tax=Gelidibacter gilvus TaxID=59602 RepID=A0A4Q0XNT6_9FLAO|nr:peptidoglycan-binding protein LysM [Gelidibacter gilvus]RXJ52543.1 peptidoglycan-binding protein LysM [Gelidibacter gilvus]
MGLFSFIKNAGEKVFGVGKAEAKEKTEAAANTKAAADELKTKEAGARKLEETIKDLKLEVEDLKIQIDDDMATVTGQAHDQSTKEKVVLVIGNTNGIASVDDQMSVEHAEPEAQFHTVIKGDTLGKIAKKYYGNAMKYPLIFDANKPMLTDPDKIYPGQVLRIPSLS